uniref:hypothetical protein n=1 Tax=Salmonella sp. s51228 TaxID=3159652 RepID=UPI0039801CB5
MDRNTAMVVRTRGGNILSFQHVKHAGFMLGIVNNTVRGKGAQGLQLDFTIHETFDGHILLESITNPGFFVAVDSQGKIKPPNSTSIQDPDCQFYIKQA